MYCSMFALSSLKRIVKHAGKRRVFAIRYRSFSPFNMSSTELLMVFASVVLDEDRAANACAQASPKSRQPAMSTRKTSLNLILIFGAPVEQCLDFASFH